VGSLIAVLAISLVRSRPAAVVMWLSVVLPACAARDAPVPWDTEQMAREIAHDLRRFERFGAQFRQVEVLAWRILEIQRSQPASLQPVRRRAYDALVWVRVATAAGAPAWLLVHADGDEDSPWRRVVINREVVARLTHPRPGEDPDGTYHGFIRYATSPTSEQVCEFARVAFLEPYLGPDSHIVAAELRRPAWRRVTGAEPVCGLS
jgi:hypothetical protein